MTVFQSTLSQMAFLFTLIVVGWLLVKIKVLSSSGASVLSKLENTLFIPALVTGTFISNFTPEKLKAAGIIFLLGSLLGIVMALIAVGVSRLCTKDDYIRRIFTYGLAFSNFGFMGNAVVSAVFPDFFMDYIILTLPLWILIYLWGVPSLLISDGEKRSLGQKAKNFLNPMFIGMVIGMIIGLTSLPLPAFLTSVINTAGSCMSPIAMLLTGMTVAEIDLKATFTNLKIYAVSVIRLLIFPLAFIGIIILFSKFTDLNTSFVVCATASLAMPLGLNTVVIPAAYGKDTSVAAGMALISHLISIGTIPLVFLLLEKII